MAIPYTTAGSSRARPGCTSSGFPSCTRWAPRRSVVSDAMPNTLLDISSASDLPARRAGRPSRSSGRTDRGCSAQRSTPYMRSTNDRSPYPRLAVDQPTLDELDRDERRRTGLGHLAPIDRPRPAERRGLDARVRPGERTLVGGLGDPGLFPGVSRTVRRAAA